MGDFENPLFLARDVAEWIEHQDVSSMLRSIDDDEKIKVIPPAHLAEGLQPNTEYWFLTEDGLSFTKTDCERVQKRRQETASRYLCWKYSSNMSPKCQ